MRLSEFEEKYVKYDMNDKKSLGPPFEDVFELLKNFHPKSMPILWRILLVQIHIYEAMKETRNLPKAETEFKVLKIMPIEERKQYDWRASGVEATDSEVIVEPFVAVQKYILSRAILKEFFVVNKDTPGS